MTTPQLVPIQLNAANPDKPLLVVGPGIGTGVQELWDPTVAHLDADFEVIGYDLPGHVIAPTSTAPYSVKELADAVAKIAKQSAAGREVYFAGVSISGGVALELALHHPETFTAVAVVCSAAKIGEPEAWEERAEIAAQNGTEVMIPFCRDGWFAPGFHEAQPAKADTLLGILRDADLDSYVTVCRALGTYDMRADLPKITLPVLAINGAHDEVCPPSGGEVIAAGVPQGKALVFENTAHLAPVEEPMRTADELRTFFLTAS
ncbi:alpha/beta fold hydrolase [Micrococcoides hystricis]|uniref:Alpha/beta fold hydrolase n=1 Tax=Micrococcoides hystricis TaxID=1572761 RepID=A0ABV6PCE9_9MICC